MSTYLVYVRRSYKTASAANFSHCERTMVEPIRKPRCHLADARFRRQYVGRTPPARSNARMSGWVRNNLF